MGIVPSLIVSSETGLCVRFLIRLRYGIVQLTGKLDIAIGIVNESFRDLGWKGRHGCKCNGKKRDAFIKHDWDVESSDLKKGTTRIFDAELLRQGCTI